MSSSGFAWFVAALVLLGTVDGPIPARGLADPGGGQAKSTSNDTPAAEFTRTKLLKARVSGEFTDTRIGDILKEFAAQVDMKLDQPVMWTYGTGFPFSKKVTFSTTDEPLETALDRLLTKAGGELGYVVLSQAGDRYDGWVRLTTGGERGTRRPAATAEEEKAAAELLASARKLLDAKKDASARVLFQLVVKKYGATRAAADARAQLDKLDK